MKPLCRLSFSLVFGMLLLPSSPSMQAADADVRVFFRDECEKAALKVVRRARKTLLVACYSLTSNYVTDALIESAENGVLIKIKIDRRCSEEPAATRLIRRLRRAGISVHTIAQPAPYSMHNKFLVADGKTVLTGSYNFTVAAARGNWENAVRLESRDVASAYEKEWESLKTRTKISGSGKSRR